MKRTEKLIILALCMSSFCVTGYAAAFRDSTFYNHLTVKIKTRDGKKITGELLSMENDSIRVLYYTPQHSKNRKTVGSTYSYKDLKIIKVKEYSLALLLTSIVLIALSTLLGYGVLIDVKKGSVSLLLIAIAGFAVAIELLIYSIKGFFHKKRFKIDEIKEKYESSRLKLLKFKT